MKAYAHGSTVISQKTQGEIMGLLGSRGVQKIMTFSESERFTLAFEYEQVPYKLSFPLPDPSEFTTYTSRGKEWLRSDSAAKELYEKELNRRWRAFGMVIKAKIVAVEEGISTIEAEFIGNVMLKDGRTLAETYAPNLSALAASGQIPALMPPGGNR